MTLAPADLPSPCDPPLPLMATAASPAEGDCRRADTVRVLHVINGEHFAGTERVQDLLALALPRLGYELGFACVKAGRFPTTRCSKAPLYRLPMRSRVDLRAVPRLVEIIRREDYRIVHAHTPRTAILARLAALAAGVPMVYHVHSPSWRDSTRRWQDRANAWAERLSIAGKVHLICVSQSLAGQMIDRGFDPARIAVVHNGVPRCQPAPYRDPPADQWTIGTVALLRPRKGVEVLLDALAIVRRQRLPARLRVVGPFETSGYEAQLKDRARRLALGDWIDWVGFRSNVDAELATMDLFVLPSLFGEGLPMVVLEAMSAGVPVIAARVEGIPEAIRDRQDGLLVEPGDPQDLARAIVDVILGRANWSMLRSSALGRHASEFSDESMASGVAGVYRRLLSARQ